MTPLLALALLLAGDGLEEVELEAVQLPTEQGLARISEWIAQHPTSPEVPRALLWQAQQRLAQERFEDARGLLERALRSNPDADLAFDLALTRADISALEGRFDDAAAAYESLHAPAGSRWAMQAALRGQTMRGEAWRHRAMAALAALCGLIIATRVVRTGRGLWPPPEEVTWSAPVLLTLCVAALSRPPSERTAVLLVCLGGVGLLWLTGASLRARALTPLARVAEVLLSVLLAGSLLFCAIVASGLWMRVADTFAAGTE